MSEIFQMLGCIFLAISIISFIASHLFLCNQVFSMEGKLDDIIKRIDEKDAVKSDKTEAK